MAGFVLTPPCQHAWKCANDALWVCAWQQGKITLFSQPLSTLLPAPPYLWSLYSIKPFAAMISSYSGDKAEKAKGEQLFNALMVGMLERLNIYLAITIFQSWYCLLEWGSTAAQGFWLKSGSFLGGGCHPLPQLSTQRERRIYGI